MDLASRARIKKNLPHILEWQKRAWQAQETGQNDLFASETSTALQPLELEEAEPWTMMEALEAERTLAFGFYHSGHPLTGLFEEIRLALWYNELKRQNDIKYGSPLVNRHRLEREERTKRSVRKFK